MVTQPAAAIAGGGTVLNGVVANPESRSAAGPVMAMSARATVRVRARLRMVGPAR